MSLVTMSEYTVRTPDFNFTEDIQYVDCNITAMLTTLLRQLPFVQPTAGRENY